VSTTVHCPACGHPAADPSRATCKACGFAFGDRRVTSEDTTPYALAYAEGNRAWWRMGRWVWSATTERLKHLALMRSSPASKHFRFINLLLLSFAALILQASSRGWHVASVVLTEGMAEIRPDGKGWLHIASSRHTSGAIGKRADAWWNPPQTIIAAALGITGAVSLAYVLFGFIRWLIERAHERSYRGEQRMTAAIDYSTAWIVPALPAAIIVGFLPAITIAEETRSAVVSGTALAILAALIAVPPVVLWWIWLVRLGATAPAETRGAVQAAFVVGAPLLTIAAVAAWWFGLHALLQYLFQAMDLNF
jgi:hypothetical protein